MNSDILEDFRKLPIWEHYTSLNKKFILDPLFEDALALMDLYYEAFPHFTLHNRQHQKNILKLIGELLGDNLTELNDLECAIIILSVAYHDIGMVFNEKELSKIEKEANFKIFLDTNYKAKLDFEENKSSASKDLIEWYCRWIHAKRVWIFLNKFDQIKWQSISLRKIVGDICESHNENASILINDVNFSTDFYGTADTRFCAVLLRLGDILDFDNTRTPRSVYEFLDLDNPKNKNDLITKAEWNKHLSSDGFLVVRQDENIFLKFNAGPEHPQIEKNIQTFLDVIEDELKNCNKVIIKCSDRFRRFRLPLQIDRSGIIPQNYKLGDFNLSLDENKIITLLTGENLYEDGLVFIRELLQNAIDSSRMRILHELSNGNMSFKIQPIEVTEWIDQDGFQWIRVDDYGMGLNQYVIENHLLKKGSSYYKSDYFKIQKLFYKEKLNEEYTPISRFGIGLLSCFILGDEIELNTKSVRINQTNSQEEEIRLSIEGLQGQYFFQTAKDNHIPKAMPCLGGSERSFRNEFGLSIAVRINKKKDFFHFKNDLEATLEYYITCSPIEIFFNGKYLGVDFSTLINPLGVENFILLSDNKKHEIEKFIENKITKDIGLQSLLIDVSSSSPEKKLKGQIICIYFKCDDFLTSFNDISIELHYQNINNKQIVFKKQVKHPISSEIENKSIEINITNEFDCLINEDIVNKIFRRNYDKGTYQNTALHLIHNGINIPNYSQGMSLPNKLQFNNSLFSYHNVYFHHSIGFACFGLIYFEDYLIPDLSIARSTIKNLGFSIYSSLYYSTKKINDLLHNERYINNYFADVDRFFSFEEIKKDKLVINGYWNNELIVNTPSGMLSINAIKDLLLTGPVKAWIDINVMRDFLWYLVSALIQLNFEVELIIKSFSEKFLLIKAIKGGLPNSTIDKCQPLLFIPFSDKTIIEDAGYINEEHFVIKWLLLNQEFLFVKYEGYFQNLIHFIHQKQINEANHVLEHFRKILPADKKPPIHNISKEDYFKVVF